MRTDVPIRELLPELAEQMRTHRQTRRSFYDLGRQQPKGPNGRPRCRWCGEEVGRSRQTFCGQACVEEFLIRNDARFAREKVWKRDRGVCAFCGTDGSPWECDHIIAVHEGGGMYGLAYLRTLCIDCHRGRTAQQAAGRARIQSDATQLTLL